MENEAQNNPPEGPAESSAVPAPTEAKKKFYKSPIFLVGSLIALVLVLILGVAFFFLNQSSINNSENPSEASKKSAANFTIGLSLDTLSESRWGKERDIMTAKAESEEASVVTLVANSDDDTQISQIRNFITQKVNVIIIVAHNAEVLTDVIDEAHAAGIKVIAYDRMILNSDLDLYISFDSVKVGEYAAQYVMAAVPKTVTTPNVVFIGGSPTDNNAVLVKNGAMSILDPLVAENKAKLVFDKFTPNWDPEIAYQDLKNYLADGGKVDAVVASNDGTATGAINALKERDLDGKVPVSGQDAELVAVKRLVDGTQTVTMYKPIVTLANKAIESAIALAEGKNLQTNSKVNNGRIDVPAFLINPVPVTKDTIKDTVIKDKFYSPEEIYGNSL